MPSSARPAPGLLEPLQLQSTPALIADRLRSGILEGRFPPHTQLAEVELARQLQVSRGPIREAMQRLIQEGLLRAERNRGVFVVELGLDDARDVYLARGVIERAAAAIVAKKRPEAALTELQAIVDRPAGTSARPREPSASTMSTWTVGRPRQSMTSRARTARISRPPADTMKLPP